MHRLTNNYAKNYCNWTLIVKVIIEIVVTFFGGGHSVHTKNTTTIRRGIIIDVLRPIWSCHGHILSILQNLWYWWPWISLRGDTRSLILAAIKSAHMTSYWISIVTLVLFCHISEILERLYAPKPLFQYPSPIPAKTSVCSFCSRSMMLGSVESEHPRLTNSKIILDFQPTWSQYLNIMDRQTDGQMDDLP